MTTTSHCYPAYKPSGVPWLGDVPVHWEVVQLGRSGVFFKGSGGTKEDEVPDGIPCVRYGDLYTTHNHFISHTRSYVSPAKASAYTPIHRGDVLFPTSGETIEEIGKSAVNLLDTHVLCGGDIIIFRPTIPMEPKFAGYALDCPAAQTQKSLMGRGITIMHIYSGQLKYLWVSLPPLPEQAAIVRYLDHMDRRIRRYVSAKRKLIGLLEEEKQAVVNQAVTRGLDPNVCLKPSGVEWLGDVPEHWEVRRLGYLATKFGSGITPRGGATVYKEYGIPFLRSQNIHFDGLRLRDVARIPPSLHWELSGSHVKPGDVLLNITGASIGRACSVPNDFTEGNVNQHVCIIRPDQGRLLSGLLAVYLSIPKMQREIQSVQSGASREGLTLESIRNFRLIVPPLTEQKNIVAYLDKATADIVAAIARARRQMELVQEYRTRLIADVVTGKLDVREAAAQLPDEDDDQDPIGESGPLADGLPGDPYDIDESAEDSAMEEEVSA